ncbi:30S ribosomal protein S20 [Erysipelothrix sp. HDW6C]|uniref:30S ribosomal protein S20 n=1 Tax=Erysipelothrix sp. HDW6C TaxID=2714930 RepID=UPI001407D884|nr:30S ribosomal protein S20 [Erysipelothrix sp. HDW6C]QIK70447.1 30S ribosomal protein S20 [Erysipelothrix sp. HDW6C]
MPQIESQKKRVLTSRKEQASNRRQKTTLKNTLVDFKTAVEAEDKEKATVLFNRSNQLLDKSITSNIHHKNYVSRKKSSISKLMNTVK